ncbi:MAG: thioredoxin family protein [Gammaproteobacteria bacterium]
MKHAPFLNTDEATFEDLVLKASHEKPVIVDFWAEWCAPCIHLAPTLDKAMLEFQDRVTLAKVEVDDNMKLAGHYRLKGFPTVIYYHEGEERDRFSGAKPLAFIRGFLQRNLAAHAEPS